MGISRQVLLWASRQAWLDEQFRKRSFARRATARFIPGESLDAALGAAGAFSEEGLTSLVSRLGENVTTANQAAQVTQHYLDVLDRIGQLGLPCQISLKPTQLGLDLSDELCSENLSALIARATESKSFIWVDMESSAYVDRTLDLFARTRKVHENVGLCVQSYLHRTADDLERLIACSAAVRLVKGAYSEPADVAKTSKKDVDSSFLILAKRLLDAAVTGNGGLPVFGTHDMRLLVTIFKDAAARGLDKRSYEIQMLYGIAREQQRELAAAGHEIRVLISYGSAWFPWYMRRLAERPANVWFVLRSVFSK
jgi:proline dehydrogenase